MTVCSKNQDSSINVLIDGCNIQSLTDLKLLRVTIDNKITFSIRIRNVCKKISMKIGALLRYFEKSYPNGHQASAVQSSNTPPLHVLSYCMALLYRASDSRKLERLQERALRAVFYNKSATYEQLLAEGQSPQPKATGHCDINVYKVKNDLCPRYVSDQETITYGDGLL